jgi:hypothetical protein
VRLRVKPSNKRRLRKQRAASRNSLRDDARKLFSSELPGCHIEYNQSDGPYANAVRLDCWSAKSN